MFKVGDIVYWDAVAFEGLSYIEEVNFNTNKVCVRDLHYISKHDSQELDNLIGNVSWYPIENIMNFTSIAFDEQTSAADPDKHTCKCPMQVLMSTGCTCGGI